MMSKLCLCGERAVWRLNPERDWKPDLIEALALGSDLDSMKIIAACTTDTTHNTFCATCADELMDGVSDDMAEDHDALRAEWLDRFRAVDAETDLDAALARAYYGAPILIRL